MPAKTTKPPKSEKPYPEFPLTPHRTSKQWCKKIRGRIIYFGSLESPEAALEKYLSEVDEWQAGRNPREKIDSSSVSLEELCNHFLEEKAGRVGSREISSRTHSDYNRTSQRLCDFIGKTRQLSSFSEETFQKIRTHFTQTMAGDSAGLVTIMNHMRRLRTLFYFALSKKWLKDFTERDLRKLLEIPSKKSRRIERNKKGPRIFEASEIRSILVSASLSMRAMTLLGINAALGQTDVSALPETAIDFETGWLNFPRVKTGIPRRCPLWPETVAALRDVIKNRRQPKDPEAAGNVFITQQGHTFIGTSDKGTHLDAIGLTFSRMIRRLKIQRPGVGFYTLRHMFETIGGETEAQVAVDHIMGHSPDEDDMSAEYREFIKDDRLKRVTDHVRLWLWPEGSEAAWMKAEAKRQEAESSSKKSKRTSKPVSAMV